MESTSSRRGHRLQALSTSPVLLTTSHSHPHNPSASRPHATSHPPPTPCPLLGQYVLHHIAHLNRCQEYCCAGWSIESAEHHWNPRGGAVGGHVVAFLPG